MTAVERSVGVVPLGILFSFCYLGWLALKGLRRFARAFRVAALRFVARRVARW